MSSVRYGMKWYSTRKERLQFGHKPCYVVGFGKAVYGMAFELHRILDSNLQQGILSIPTGSLALASQQMSTLGYDLKKFEEKFKTYEGAKNNLPDLDAMRAAIEIETLCKSLDKDDVLIVLISGGGSALLPSVRDGIVLEEKQKLVKLLFDRGANINEVNSVRKRLSNLKGGGLAKICYPARVVSLILSDVIGDPLDIIASGPTVQNRDTNSLAVEILKKYKIVTEISPKTIEILTRNDQNRSGNVSGPENEIIFENVQNFVIGNNTLACNSAKQKSESLGYESLVLSTNIDGQVQDLAKFYYELAEYLTKKDVGDFIVTNFLDVYLDLAKLRRIKLSTKPVCLIFGGEPTIIVKNKNGRGGRNQHLALEFATLLADLKDKHVVHFLSCGTDGVDGPTDAAGALSPVGFTNEDINNAKEHLDQSDSYSFFKMYKNGEFLINTGHTGTNVMDIHLLIVDKL